MQYVKVEIDAEQYVKAMQKSPWILIPTSIFTQYKIKDVAVRAMRRRYYLTYTIVGKYKKE